MPDPDGACFYVTDPPDVDYIDGLFHVTRTIGGKRCEIVMRPHPFMVTLRRFAECASKHKFGGAEIIPVDFDSKFEKRFKGDKGA